MLILTRRPNETLMIGTEITVTVLGVKGNQVRIGVNAPAASIPSFQCALVPFLADQRPTTERLVHGTSHSDVSLRCRTLPHIPRKFTR